MAFVSSDLKNRIKATGWPAYADADSSHLADPSYFNAGNLTTQAGHYNSLLNELYKTQVMMGNWSGRVANVLDYGVTGDGVTDDTIGFQAACADPTKDTVFIPPKCVVRIRQTVYVPQKKMLLGNFGTRHVSLATSGAGNIDLNHPAGCILVDLVSPFNVGLQLGGLQGLSGCFIFSGSGMRACWLVDFNLIENQAPYYDFADDPSTAAYGPGSSDGFFGNNWLANYSGGFNALGCIKITNEMQGWWFVNNVCDGFFQYGLKAVGQTINCRFLGNRYHTPSANSPCIANAEFFEPYSNVNANNLYDYGSGWGLKLISPQDCMFTNEQIHKPGASGLCIDNTAGGTLPWYEPWDDEGLPGEQGDPFSSINGNSNHFTNLKIGNCNGNAILLNNAKNAHFESVGLGMCIADRNSDGAAAATPLIECIGATGCTFGMVHAHSYPRTKAIRFDVNTSNCGIDLLKRSGGGTLLVDNLGGGTNYVTREMTL